MTATPPQREWVDVECPLCGEMAVAHTHPNLKNREWVGMTEEEIDKLKHLIDWTATWSHGRFAYEIEQLLKEKNA